MTSHTFNSLIFLSDPHVGGFANPGIYDWHLVGEDTDFVVPANSSASYPVNIDNSQIPDGKALFLLPLPGGYGEGITLLEMPKILTNQYQAILKFSNSTNSDKTFSALANDVIAIFCVIDISALAF